jgi:two-component system, NarL family, nitrate/nitrite response regulator NarL
MSNVAIITDSALLSTVIDRAVAASFNGTRRQFGFRSIPHGEDLRDSIVIIDAVSPDAVIQLLETRTETVDLERTIILMRSDQFCEDYASVVGRVGGLLPADFTVEEIALAAKLVRRGLSMVPTAVLAVIGADEFENVALDEAPLTEREDSVLNLIAEGAGNKTIARRLNISDSTVRVHVRSIMKKLGVQNRTQAALRAVRQRTPQRQSAAVKLPAKR